MNKNRFKWLGLVVLSLATLLVMNGCGASSSSSSSNPQPGVAKTTVSGSVSFPSIGSLVAKRAGSIVADETVTVKAYTIDGTEVGSATPTYDDSSATRVYSYSIANLNTDVDYVIKVTKNGAVLKKLIERKDVTAGTVVGQNINSVSTAAVIIASKKLDVVLGDPIPAGKNVTVTSLSSAIGTDIKPLLLEGAIDAAVSGGISAITDSNKAAFANVFNIVVTAGVQGIDPAKMFTAAPPALTNTVPILTVASGASTATVTQTTVNASTVATSAAPTYTAPTETAATYNTLAKQYLAAQDISNAALSYERALAINPNDPEANFGGAITSGLMLTDDSDVQAIITKWGAVVPTVNQIVKGTSPIKLPFSNLTSIKLAPKTLAKSVASAATVSSTQNVLTAFSALKSVLPQQKSGFKSVAKQLGLVPATAPTVSEMQTLIDNVIIPKIDKILARLAKAETANLSFTITKAMQGNPVNGKDVTLNSGEFYTLDAALNIFQVLFKIASSYNFDLPSGVTYDTIGQDPLAFINSPTFFTLKSTGTAKMSSALTNAQAAAAKASLAFNVVKNRALGEGTFDLTSWTPLDKTDFTNELNKVTSALAGPYTLTEGTKTVNINATKFFTNPLTRVNLPTFGYDVPRNATLSLKYDDAVAGERSYTVQVWNGTAYVNQTRTYPIHSEIEPTSDLPDYTLNGIPPGNTPANNIAEFNGLLPMKDGKLLTGSVDDNAWGFTTDGTSIYYVPSNYAYTPGQPPTYTIKKIDTATGIVSTVASGTNFSGRLLWYNGGFYGISSNGQYDPATGNFTYATTISPITITGSSFTIGTATWTSPSSSSSYLSSVASNGTDIYYSVSAWNQLTGTNSVNVRKLSNLTTDVSLFTTPDYVDSLAFQNGYLYTDGEKRDPAASYNVIASYANGHSAVVVSGYFYQIHDRKLVRFAGTPAGGAAKAVLAKYFGL